jgi:hypothetical protein
MLPSQYIQRSEVLSTENEVLLYGQRLENYYSILESAFGRTFLHHLSTIENKEKW